MTIQISFKQIQSSDALREFTEEKSKKLEEHFGEKFHILWTFSIEHLDHIAHCHVLGKNMNYFADARTLDLFESVEEAIKKVEKQIARHKQSVAKAAARHARRELIFE